MHYYNIISQRLFINANGLGGANPAVNTPRPSRGTRIESCDFIVLIGDPSFFLFVSFCLASRVEWERRALSISFV